MTNTCAIELLGVTKGYGSRDVVFSEADLRLPQGRIIGLIGENGSGKTTFIKLISGMTRQDSGEIRVLGQPLRDEKTTVALRSHISILGDANRALYWNMSGMDNIEYFWTLKTGKPLSELPQRVLDNITRFNMGSFIHKKVETYSKGMKQRLLLLICLLSEPRILFMDEPLNGLDFDNAFILKGIIRDFTGKQGGTVIITSHDRSFINEICDEQYVIRHRRIEKCETFSPANKEITLYVRFLREADRQLYISRCRHEISTADENILKITAGLNDPEIYAMLAGDLQAGKLQILEVRS